MKLKFVALAVAALAMAAPAMAQDAHDRKVLGLASNGVTLTDAESEETDTVGFGTSQDDTVQFVGTALGDPEGSGVNEECDLGWVKFQGDLMLYFKAGEFSGWTILGDSGFATPEGLTIGTTWPDMVKMFDETSGEDNDGTYMFEAGGYGGVLTEGGDSGTVKAVWAGTKCVG
jgi:hypothetical protein